MTARAAAAQGVRLVLNAAVWITGLSLVVRAASAVKEILFARAYGVSSDTDAFVLAATYIMFLPTILGSAVNTALISSLSDGNGSYRGAGWQNLSWGVAAAAICCAALMYALAPFAMNFAFNQHGASLEKATLYARILSPLGATLLIGSVLQAVLNSAKQFYVASIAGIATPITMIALILALSDMWGVEAAAWGMSLGAVLEVIVLAWRIHAQRAGLFGGAGDAGARIGWKFWHSAAVLALAGSISILSPMIDQVFLSRLETGAVTSLSYASKVNSLLIGIFGTGVSAAIYPYLSDLAAKRDLRGLKHLTWRLSAIVLPLTGLATLIVFIFSYDIVGLLFARGRFTAESVVEVGSIQKIFAFQLPLYVAGLLAMRVLNAANASRLVLYTACINVVCNASLDWLLYRPLGAGGIALSSVITSAISLACVIAFIRPALAAHSK